MTGARAVGQLPWAAIGAGLVLAGCGSAAAPTAASRRGPANGSGPNARAVQPNGAQRCTQVYCVPQAVPRGPANKSAPNAQAVQPNGAQRCTQVYCIPQAVPRGPANKSAPNARAVQPNGAQRCTQVYCVPQAVPRGPATFATPGWRERWRPRRTVIPLAGTRSLREGRGLRNDGRVLQRAGLPVAPTAGPTLCRLRRRSPSTSEHKSIIEMVWALRRDTTTRGLALAGV